MRALFESRAAVLKAEAEAKLLDKQIELERLRQSRDTTLLRQALEALEIPIHAQPFGMRVQAITAIKEHLK